MARVLVVPGVGAMRRVRVVSGARVLARSRRDLRRLAMRAVASVLMRVVVVVRMVMLVPVVAILRMRHAAPR